MDQTTVSQYIELAKQLDSAKSELNGLGRFNNNIFTFSETQEQLDAIIQNMADATNRILDNVEEIEKLSQKDISAAHSDKISPLITQIYENCTFQDLSGQRISKVSKILKDVERLFNQIFEQYEVEESEKEQTKITAEKIKQIFHMKNMLEKLKSELLEINEIKVESKLLSSSFNELEEVISNAERATHFILSSVEGLHVVCNKVSDSVKNEFQACINSIFEACSFQDLVGQRIRKVLRTLDQINKIILKIYKYVKNDESLKSLSKDQVIEDGHILHGPQMPQKALKQDVVDALMGNVFENNKLK